MSSAEGGPNIRTNLETACRTLLAVVTLVTSACSEKPANEVPQVSIITNGRQIPHPDLVPKIKTPLIIDITFQARQSRLGTHALRDVLQNNILRQVWGPRTKSKYCQFFLKIIENPTSTYREVVPNILEIKVECSVDRKGNRKKNMYAQDFPIADILTDGSTLYNDNGTFTEDDWLTITNAVEENEQIKQIRHYYENIQVV